MPVSVIVPAYNVAAVIGRAVRSALDQTVPPLEILVVDDCSADDTVAAVRRLESPLVRILSTRTNGGPGAARNVGLAEARGEWTALLDADDVWKPDFIERVTAAAEAHAADMLLLNVVLWDDIAGREVRFALPEDGPVRRIGLQDLFENDTVDFEFRAFSWATLKAVFRTAFVAGRGLRYDETLRMGEDFIFYAECLFNGANAFLFPSARYVYSMPTPPSGKSAHSRTQYNFLPLLERSDALCARYADRIDARLASAIARRRRVIRLIHEANVAREFRHAGRYARYAWYVGGRPDLAQSLLFRGLNAVRRRVREGET